MDNVELKELLINPRPVMFGGIIFNGIIGIIWRRLHRGTLLERDIGIVQVEAIDRAGAKYTINPKHLKPAKPGADQLPEPDVDTLIGKKKLLLDVYRDWCEEHDVAVTLEHFLIFLYAEDLINASKAYNVILSRETTSC